MLDSHSTDGAPPPTIKIYNPAPEPPTKPKSPPTTVLQAFDRFVLPGLKAKNRSAATIADVQRSANEWTAFWNASKAAANEQWILDPLLIRQIRRRHLEAWQAALIAAKNKHGGALYSPSSVNRKLGGIRQILNASEQHGKIKKRPRLEKLPTKPARKFYMRPEQMNALWPAFDKLDWPRMPGMSTANWWRCSLVIYWVYGMRTQELIQFQFDKQPLTWSAITLDTETPNPDGTATNALGWLSYVPQKQSWAKPDPLYLPLTRHTRAAFDRLRKAAAIATGDETAIDPARPVCPWPGNHRKFYQKWCEAQKLAGIASKGGEPFLVKSMRKSAATFLESHHKGLGAAVCGWADRSASAVMEKHYAVDELMLVDKLATYPVPSCFDTLLQGG